MLGAVPGNYYQFGEFEVDAVKRLLLRGSHRIPLTSKAFDVLLVLVERHGEVVSKDELLRTVWQGVLVEEISLTRNISVIRKVLGERPDEHRFIVTVPGTGYRFVAEVERSERPNGGIRAAVPARRSWPWITAAALVAVAGTLGWRFWPKDEPGAFHPVPLSSYPGREDYPALSPDGNQVAFTWDGEKQDNRDIYLKSFGSATPLRLTTNPAEDVSPAWSPDGRNIAFLRRLSEDRTAVVLISAVGGPEHKLAETWDDPARQDLASVAWSPDGRWLAVAHREAGDPTKGIFLISTRTGEKRRITAPEGGVYGDFMPAFSPDGRTLAFTRLQGYAAGEVYLVPLSEEGRANGELRCLTRSNQWAINPAWTRDGSHIVYLFSEGHEAPRELRVVAASGSRASERILLAEEGISRFSLSRHLAYSRSTRDTNIWRAEIRKPGAGLSTPEPLISSTRVDTLARYSPDGRRIAFASTRSGAWEIWLAEADGSNPVQLTSFGGPHVAVTGWSPDGRELAFHGFRDLPEGKFDLFTVPTAGGAAKRLTTDPLDGHGPSYSRDGRWLYFSSRRSGRLEIWRMPAAGGEATQITQMQGGWLPLESFDGSTVYYCHEFAHEGIWKVPAQGGKAVQVAASSRTPGCRLAVTADGIFYTPEPKPGEQHSIDFLSFATGRSRPVVVSGGPFDDMGLSVSRDQRYILYTQADQSGSDLMLITDLPEE